MTLSVCLHASRIMIVKSVSMGMHKLYYIGRYIFMIKYNKYFELKNSWGANGVPQTRTTC